MNKEWKVFLTAVQFLTRIRVPASIHHQPGLMQQAPRYFPLVGWIVGALSALFFLVFGRYISTDVGIIASMCTSLLVTGAFHEDGFADVCDGFGGGWTKEKILLIMKDSRVGAFGAIGLIFILGTKFALLRELPGFIALPGEPTHLIFYHYRYFILALIAAHSVSRLMAVLVLQTGSYAGNPDQSKSVSMTGGRLSIPALILATAFALAPFAFLPWPFLLTVLPALYATYELYRYFKKWIGGYTGDCLGAIQQVTEIVIYLGFIIVWRYL
ncbi:adenosylcobinamide-GDP ribazoletransferase [Puia sp.]|jgi:adenosylcobinamide-GDP ribazoletransferase|uniref:adenosylcobinamide-GDP ribazoletransferase n=1 Tax=Puia sp. TaxID=2045100 RepID=UPI002F42C86D